MTYTIERGTEMPRRTHKYPFRDLAISTEGSTYSFFVPLTDAKSGVIRAAASNAGRRLGRKFKVSRDVTNGINGHRVWRVA